jgi:hypothetical protein
MSRRRSKHRVSRTPSGMWRKRDEPVMEEAGVGIVNWSQGLAICPGLHEDGLARVHYNGVAFTIWCPRPECVEALRQTNEKLAAAFPKKHAESEQKRAWAREMIASIKARRAATTSAAPDSPPITVGSKEESI